jgi:inorganic pyrophosphatase
MTGETVRVFVESEGGTNVRRVFDETTLELRSERRVSVAYPFPYGFILGTITDDGSAVDCFLLSAERIAIGTIVSAEPVGLLEQIENEEIDHKVLAVPAGESWSVDASLQDTLRAFIRDLFRPYADVRVEVGRILGADAAMAFIASRAHGRRPPAGSPPG